MTVPPRNVTFGTPRSLAHRRVTLRLVAKGALAPSALNAPGRSRSGTGVASTYVFSGRNAITGGHPNPLLEADRRSRLAAARSEGLSPVSPARGAPSPCPGRDLA